ncbi:acid protease [Exidia glandulosa HHB12029]|uniref:Acid protease n=1 Tax=Exidia glandulosa HHB12029 TaxID=1314781 RepID=A0A165N681_EXIGL|nr:acid protease [Exidia glandulosa HHB12029]
MSHSPLAVLAAAAAIALAAARPAHQEAGVVHLPIVRTPRQSTSVAKRAAAGTHAAIGLGDFFDVTYSVLVNVGPVLTPLVLDTGSSDLWVISDACTNCTDGEVPLFPAADLKYAGLDVALKYGDSSTRTHANGPIGTSSMGVAGLELESQYLAAINDTDTTIAATGAVGIFGLGFPISSVVFADVFKQRFVTCPDCRAVAATTAPNLRRNHVRTRRPFPELSSLFAAASTQLAARTPGIPSLGDLLSLVPSAAPFMPRAVNEKMLAEPLIAVTLQRETIDPGGNVGMLSLGGFPASVDRDKLTWVDVRGYTAVQAGLPETVQDVDTYPLAWEIPLDDVYLDGKLLPRTNLTSTSISITALVDTGSSLVRGPSDVIEMVTRLITSPNSNMADPPQETYDCTPHTLAFRIGGQLFPVDPRDLVAQATPDVVGVSDADAARVGCSLNLAVTDTPEEGNGFLFTWSLGVPFLKSVLAAFYYGNVTHPELDRPRIGLLSTVPQNADSRLTEAISAAGASDGNLPALSQSAPTTTYVPIGTGVAGVPLAATSIGNSFSRPPKHSTAGSPPTRRIALSAVILAMLAFLAALFALR